MSGCCVQVWAYLMYLDEVLGQIFDFVEASPW
jgi:hypothetical protein